VHNFWWQGIALMEAAATRAVHGEAADAAAELVAVLDHWERVGDWTQQWLTMRYMVRLLLRVGRLLDGPDGDRYAAALTRGSALPGAAAVAYARSVLRMND
jgi:hypothetical protein